MKSVAPITLYIIYLNMTNVVIDFWQVDCRILVTYILYKYIYILLTYTYLFTPDILCVLHTCIGMINFITVGNNYYELLTEFK